MNSRPYTVHIYEREATLLSKWTLQYPNIETGGDLFGLWLNANEVVIQVVIGPGQNCRRTTTSFLQDEQYLNSVGELLIRDQGLCRVGSWLSHASDMPDDNENVWRQLPTPGRFLLLIAVIKTETETPKVEMGFKLFESTVEGNKMTPMKLDILQGEGPVRANKGLNSKILEGAELHSNTSPYPEPAVPEPAMQSSLARSEVSKPIRAEGPEISRPDIKSNEKFEDGSGFFQGKRRQPDRQGHRRPLNQGATCDGAPLSPVSYNTFQRSYHREFRHPRQHHHPKRNRHAYTYDVHNLPDGRQGITLYHNDHPVGRCEDCYNTTATLSKNSKLRVVHGQDRTGRCTIV